MSHPDKPSAPEVYYEAFGRFIQYYALAETQVHLLFWHISGLHLNAARSISSGMRLSDLMTITKSVIASRDLGEELASKVENAFTHLSEIGSLRDKLVHRGAEITENVIISSNAKTAATKENIEVMRLNIGDIRLAMSDCMAIVMRLMMICDPAAEALKIELGQRLLRLPWLYKPPPLDMPYKEAHKKIRKRPPPQKTSAE